MQGKSIRLPRNKGKNKLPDLIAGKWLANSQDKQVRKILHTGYEIIELIGDLLYGTNPNAIEAGANRNSVYLHFNQSFGNVNIKIYNATGSLCYSGVVDTTVQQTVIIPISGNNDGTYTVVLDNANGYAEGEFNR